MEFSATQIADILGGVIEGNPEEKVNNLSKIEEGKPHTLSFLANPKYTPYIYNTKASVVIVNNTFKAEQKITATLIRVDDAYESFSKLLAFYDQYKHNKIGVSKNAAVSESANLGDNVFIGNFVSIGDNVIIGDNVKIYPNTVIADNVTIGESTIVYANVSIYDQTQIGKQCTIHSGTVIGADGFGFAPNSDNQYNKVPQIGNVIIEDHVEIGACSTIDRATLGSTIIRKGVKLDNQIQVAHNVEIGKHTVIASQSGVAGSTKVGENNMIGGQVGIVGHVEIGKNVKIAAQSGIAGSIKDNQIIQGSPAFGISDYRKSYVYFRKLPKIVQEIDTIKKILKEKK